VSSLSPNYPNGKHPPVRGVPGDVLGMSGLCPMPLPKISYFLLLFSSFFPFHSLSCNFPLC
jgi:hypothetical protein